MLNVMKLCLLGFALGACNSSTNTEEDENIDSSLTTIDKQESVVDSDTLSGPQQDTATGSASDSETATTDYPCVAEGEEFFAKMLGKNCCDNLQAVSREDIPRDDYTQDDYPPGCGPKPETPPDLMVCIACGDGVCGTEEHFCNCPSDCPTPY